MASALGRKTAPGLQQWIPLPYGSLARSRRDPLGFLTEGARRYGDVFRHRLGPWVFHLVSHPDHVKYVLQDHQKNFVRSWLYRMTKEIIGDGLVSTEGPTWRRQRRLVQPAFQHHRIAGLAGVMTDATDAMLVRWQAAADRGRPLDVADEMMRLTLSIVGRTLFGVDLGGEADVLGPALTNAMEYLDHRLNHLMALPSRVPTPRNRRFRQSLRTIDAFLYGIIRDRRREAKDTGDLLSMLLSARDEETGEGLSDREVRDQAITFVGAGYETTAVALTWVWYLLSQDPAAERRVRSEVAEVLGGRTPTFADLPRLAFTRMVIEEALRLYPPVYALARDAVEDDEIGGYHIPARSMVILSQYVTHRHPAFWDDPDKFDPDRFTPERSAHRPRYAYFPFLGGPHQCIGNEFAMMEAQLVVAMTVQRFRLALATDAPVLPRPMVSLRPRGGMPMTIHESR